MSNAPFDESDFEDLLDRQGADPARWPLAERTRANALLQASPQAQALLAEAQRLAEALDQAFPPMPVPAALESRILAGISRPSAEAVQGGAFSRGARGDTPRKKRAFSGGARGGTPHMEGVLSGGTQEETPRMESALSGGRDTPRMESAATDWGKNWAEWLAAWLMARLWRPVGIACAPFLIGFAMGMGFVEDPSDLDEQILIAFSEAGVASMELGDVP